METNEELNQETEAKPKHNHDIPPSFRKGTSSHRQTVQQRREGGDSGGGVGQAKGRQWERGIVHKARVE